jgi:hypothetical protein
MSRDGKPPPARSRYRPSSSIKLRRSSKLLSKTLFVQISLTARRNFAGGSDIMSDIIMSLYLSLSRRPHPRQQFGLNGAAAAMVACETPFVFVSRSKSASYFS